MWRDAQCIGTVLPQLRFAATQVCPAGRGRAWISGSRPPGAPPRAQGISWKDAILAALFVAVPAGLLSAVSVLSWGCCLWVMGSGAGDCRLSPAGSCLSSGNPFRGSHWRGCRPDCRLQFCHRHRHLAGFCALCSAPGLRHRSVLRLVIKQSTALVQTNPEAQAQWHAYVHFLLTPDGRAAYTLMNAATTSVGIILFSALGGALGVRLLAPRKPTS